MSDGAHAVSDYLSSFTYTWSTELELQEAIWPILREQFDGARREAQLSARDRPDFIVDLGGGPIAIEVKVKGSRNAILRQLGRYAEHDDITAIVLASGKRTLLSGIPKEIHGKPIVVALVAAKL